MSEALRVITTYEDMKEEIIKAEEKGYKWDRNWSVMFPCFNCNKIVLNFWRKDIYEKMKFSDDAKILQQDIIPKK